MGSIGFRELLVILVIALLIFGGKKLRTIGSDLGAAVHDFKKAMDKSEKDAAAPPPAPLRQLSGQDAEFKEAEAQKSEQKTPS
ncbi:MAG: twin-arginine translocase TatA/TatE family subunit [Pseudomonadota bacterium]|jgi:sec-independent protein translocase protein TatA